MMTRKILEPGMVLNAYNPSYSELWSGIVLGKNMRSYMKKTNFKKQRVWFKWYTEFQFLVLQKKERKRADKVA
jgi:hypothetical protein